MQRLQTETGIVVRAKQTIPPKKYLRRFDWLGPSLKFGNLFSTWHIGPSQGHVDGGLISCYIIKTILFLHTPTKKTWKLLHEGKKREVRKRNSLNSFEMKQTFKRNLLMKSKELRSSARTTMCKVSETDLIKIPRNPGR